MDMTLIALARVLRLNREQRMIDARMWRRLKQDDKMISAIRRARICSRWSRVAVNKAYL